jgi:hypothetical protein
MSHPSLTPTAQALCDNIASFASGLPTTPPTSPFDCQVYEQYMNGEPPSTPLRAAVITIILFMAMHFLCVQLSISRQRSFVRGEIKLVRELAEAEPEERDRILRERCEALGVKVEEEIEGGGG